MGGIHHVGGPKHDLPVAHEPGHEAEQGVQHAPTEQVSRHSGAHAALVLAAHSAITHSGMHAAIAAAKEPTHEVTVKPGDSLWAIATHLSGHGVHGTVPEIVGRIETLNPHLKNPDLIMPGERLRVPGTGEAAHPAPAPAQQDGTPPHHAPAPVHHTPAPVHHTPAPPHHTPAPPHHTPGPAQGTPVHHPPVHGAAPVTHPHPHQSALSSEIMDRAHAIGNEIDRTGGYRFDGKNDCYGFLRRVWNPVLEKSGHGDLPISDLGDKRWQKLDWSKLKVGDVLATAQGHKWGADWHCGLFAGMRDGKPWIYDNSGSKSAELRPLPYNDYFSYFYTPVHKML